MGLTIHWQLKAPEDMTADGVRQVIEKVRQAAMDLPFEEVSEIREVKGQDACDFEKQRDRLQGKDSPERDEELFWFLIQSTQHVSWRDKGQREGESYSRHISPLHMIGFSAWPGPGSEPVNIILALYPTHFWTGGYRSRRLSTRVKGWTGRGFCKTQYASDPKCGGAPNFVRCHGSVVALLDKAKELGILRKVHDEGHFWKKRNVKALVEEVGQWNGMIASFFGALKDAIGDKGVLVAPITEYPNFEHLEMEGRIGRDNLPQVVRQMKKIIPEHKED